MKGYVGDLLVGELEITGRALRDPKREAALIHRLIAPYIGVTDPGVDASLATRTEYLKTLLAGVDHAHMAEIRSAYVDAYGTDLVHHALVTGLLQSFIHHRTKGKALTLEEFLQWRKSQSGTDEKIEELAVQIYQRIIQDPKNEPDTDTVEMFNVLMAPLVHAQTDMVQALSSKMDRGEALTSADRDRYYAELPMIGIRTRSSRPGSAATLEERALKQDWSVRLSRHDDLDAIPPANPPLPKPTQKSVAVFVSSQGAQWQELMGYVMKMRRHGVHVQLFTPEGRPAAFQLDSLLRSATSVLGYGAPDELDVQGPSGLVAKQLLAHVLPAANFSASRCAG